MPESRYLQRYEVHLDERTARWNAEALKLPRPLPTPRYEPCIDPEHSRWLQQISKNYFRDVKEYHNMLAKRSILRIMRDFLFGPVSFHEFCYPQSTQSGA